jgi:hypothetical protein
MKKLLILLAVVSAVTANLYPDKYDKEYKAKYPISREVFIKAAKEEFTFLKRISRESKKLIVEIKKETGEENKVQPKELADMETQTKESEKRLEALEKRIKELESIRDKRKEKRKEQKPSKKTIKDYDVYYAEKYSVDDNVLKFIEKAKEELENLTKSNAKPGQVMALQRRINFLLAIYYKKPVDEEEICRNPYSYVWDDYYDYYEDLYPEISDIKKAEEELSELNRIYGETYSNQRIMALKERLVSLKNKKEVMDRFYKKFDRL